MREKRIGRASARLVTDWKRLQLQKDSEIRRAIKTDPEARATNREFWKSAKVVLPRRKHPVTMRLDADLLEWFRRQKGYQTRINSVLRSYMQAHTGETS